MRNRVAIVIFAVVLITILTMPGLLESIFTLVLIGIIPSTGYVIPYWVMLSIYAILIISGIYAIKHHISIVSNPIKLESASRDRARKKVTKNSAARLKNATKTKSATKKAPKRKLQTAKEA